MLLGALHPIVHCVLHRVVHCVPCSMRAVHVVCCGVVRYVLHTGLLVHFGAVPFPPFEVMVEPASHDITIACCAGFCTKVGGRTCR